MGLELSKIDIVCMFAFAGPSFVAGLNYQYLERNRSKPLRMIGYVNHWIIRIALYYPMIAIL